MKRAIWFVLAFLLLLDTLTGCGKQQTEVVDLQAFFDEICEKYELAGMVELEGEMLDAFYPGLTDLDTPQRVAYAPMISASVSEYVFLQCADRETAQAAETILRQRIEDQAGGGAWYPESMAAWSRARVVTKDNYVLLIASDGATDAIAADFEKLL